MPRYLDSSKPVSCYLYSIKPVSRFGFNRLVRFLELQALSSFRQWRKSVQSVKDKFGLLPDHCWIPKSKEEIVLCLLCVAYITKKAWRQKLTWILALTFTRQQSLSVKYKWTEDPSFTLSHPSSFEQNILSSNSSVSILRCPFPSASDLLMLHYNLWQFFSTVSKRDLLCTITFQLVDRRSVDETSNTRRMTE